MTLKNGIEVYREDGTLQCHFSDGKYLVLYPGVVCASDGHGNRTWMVIGLDTPHKQQRLGGSNAVKQYRQTYLILCLIPNPTYIGFFNVVSPCLGSFRMPTNVWTPQDRMFTHQLTETVTRDSLFVVHIERTCSNAKVPTCVLDRVSIWRITTKPLDTWCICFLIPGVLYYFFDFLTITNHYNIGNIIVSCYVVSVQIPLRPHLFEGHDWKIINKMSHGDK